MAESMSYHVRSDPRVVPVPLPYAGLHSSIVSGSPPLTRNYIAVPAHSYSSFTISVKRKPPPGPSPQEHATTILQVLPWLLDYHPSQHEALRWPIISHPAVVQQYQLNRFFLAVMNPIRQAVKRSKLRGKSLSGPSSSQERGKLRQE